MGKNCWEILQLTLFNNFFLRVVSLAVIHVELVDPVADSILVFVSLERVIMSIFRYLKQLANELPHPIADVLSVPASTIVAVNCTVESTLSTKKGVARATIAIATGTSWTLAGTL